MSAGELSLAAATELFDRRRRAWLAEDLDAYIACWSPSCRFQSPVHAEPIHGQLLFAELVRASAQVVQPVRFDVAHLAVDGPYVLAEWTITVRKRDDGREITWSGMSRAEIHGGLIVDWREYWNPQDLAMWGSEAK